MGVVHGGGMGMHVGAVHGVGWDGIGTWVWCLRWGERGSQVGCSAVGWDEYVSAVHEEGEKFGNLVGWDGYVGVWDGI